MIAIIADFSHRFAMNRWVRGWLSFHPVFRLIFVWIIAILLIPVVIVSIGLLSLTVSIITVLGVLVGTEDNIIPNEEKQKAARIIPTTRRAGY